MFIVMMYGLTLLTDDEYEVRIVKRWDSGGVYTCLCLPDGLSKNLMMN